MPRNWQKLPDNPLVFFPRLRINKWKWKLVLLSTNSQSTADVEPSKTGHTVHRSATWECNGCQQTWLCMWNVSKPPPRCLKSHASQLTSSEAFSVGWLVYSIPSLMLLWGCGFKLGLDHAGYPRFHASCNKYQFNVPWDLLYTWNHI